MNELFGLSIPIPTERHWTRRRLAEPCYDDPDLYYAELLSAIADEVFDDLPHCPSLLRHNCTYIPSQPKFDSLFDRIYSLERASDEELLAHVSAKIEFLPIDLAAIADSGPYCYTKLNHGFWERLCLIATHEDGRTYHRRIKDGPTIIMSARYVAVQQLMNVALSRYQCLLKSSSEPKLCFVSDAYAFAMSFNNGNNPYSEDIRIPLAAKGRSAMIGALSFFSDLVPAAIKVGDGHANKGLVLGGRLPTFFSNATNCAELIVFIVPSHLRQIKLIGWKGASIVIEVPPTCIHQLWPAVLPYVLGYMSELTNQYECIAVFTQAGAMSVPLGIALDIMSRKGPGAAVRYFDLGQVLDVAGGTRALGGGWVRKVKATRDSQVPITLFG